MPKAITSSIIDFAFDTLMCTIKTEKEYKGKGMEHDPADGMGFEAVWDPTASSSSTAHASTFNGPVPASLTATPLLLLMNIWATSTTQDFDSSSESSSSSDTCNLVTQKQKGKSKSKITYKKLAFKKPRTADRWGVKDNIHANVRLGIRKQHTFAAPINVPSFSLDTNVPTWTGYVAMQDLKANKWVYKLQKLVGKESKLKCNLVEWDGK